MTLERILAYDNPESKENACLRCNLRILPASADSEIGNVSFDR